MTLEPTVFQSTRRRLALWYTAVTALLLLLFATGIYLYFRNTLIERVDDTLNHVAEVVERSLVVEPRDRPSEYGDRLRVNIEASFRDNADTLEDDRIDLEWFDLQGHLRWSTLNDPLDLPLHPERTSETVYLSNNDSQDAYTHAPLRQITKQVEICGEIVGYLRVSHPWFEVTKPSRQLLIDLSWGMGLMVISVAASGWFLSEIAMTPVRESYQRLKQFTADASHELRSPIATIQANVQAALSDPELNADSDRAGLQTIERLTRRLSRLVDDLLFLARQDSQTLQPNWEEVPLDALLMEVVEEQQAIAADKGVTLSLELAEPPPELCDREALDAFTLRGDWNQLARLFTNLVANAVQYTPAGGTVTVALQCSRANNRQSNCTALQVRVSDTGIGISEEALPHIFKRFYRVDPARSHNRKSDRDTGSGLGLAIVWGIVTNHRGKIQVESQLGRGTTVTIDFPTLAPPEGRSER